MLTLLFLSKYDIIVHDYERGIIMEFKTLNLDKNPENDEIKYVIEENLKIAAKIKKEIDSYNNTDTETKSIPTNIKIIPKEEPKSEEELSSINNDFEDEVTYYYSMIQALKDEEFTEEKVLQLLPSKNNIRYEDIILRICAEYIKEIKEYEELITIDEISITKDELVEYKNEIRLIEQKINVLKKASIQKESIQEDVTNNLVFVETMGGNIKVFEDLNSIATEYYDEFKSLFDSIINGNFKSVKRLLNNNAFSGLSEVKGYKARVIFDRIGNNEYAVLAAFIKKTDTNKSHAQKLENIAKNYQRQETYLKSQLSNPNFLEKQNEYTTGLYDLLDIHKKQKVKQRGEINNE